VLFQGGFSVEGGIWFLGFICWEVIPISIFILSYWPASPSSELPHYHHPHSSTLSSSSLPHLHHQNILEKDKPIFIREAEPLLSSNLFTNPARYDSDGEDVHAFDGTCLIVFCLFCLFFTKKKKIRNFWINVLSLLYKLAAVDVAQQLAFKQQQKHQLKTRLLLVFVCCCLLHYKKREKSPFEQDLIFPRQFFHFLWKNEYCKHTQKWELFSKWETTFAHFQCAQINQILVPTIKTPKKSRSATECRK
jgi:hypothetical protein